jgi:HAD superfamily hydrolase (TIGR01490 family)
MEKTQLVVFDFDHTLYSNDCTLRIWKYVIKTRPSRILYLPRQILFVLLHQMGLCNTKVFKEQFLAFLNGISRSELDEICSEFWSKEWPKNFNKTILNTIEKHLKENYEVWIISASPEWFIQPLLSKQFQGVNLSATRLKHIDRRYLIDGENCKGPEKIIRIRKILGETKEFFAAYSDNTSDLPLLKMAREGYVVRNGMAKRI